MKKIVIPLAVIALCISLYATRAFACGTGWFESPCSTADTVADNQNRLERVVPVPQLQSSLERINIKKRLELFSDENKTSYIYLINFGKVMAFYTVKGKITSGSKRLTPQNVSVDNCGNVTGVGVNTNCSGSYAIEQPELDGTYGGSAPYIFFWTTDGTYVQWNGDYMLADKPLQLSTPPELVRSIK